MMGVEFYADRMPHCSRGSNVYCILQGEYQGRHVAYECMRRSAGAHYSMDNRLAGFVGQNLNQYDEVDEKD